MRELWQISEDCPSRKRSGPMSRRLLALAGLLLLSGCLYNARQRADEVVCGLASQPFDLAPAMPPATRPDTGTASPSSEKKSAASQFPALDVQTTALLQATSDPQQFPKPRLEP